MSGSSGGSAVSSEPGERWKALRERSDVFRTLFDRMDEGYCVIEFIDGPHGPLSDYVHVTANAAYTENAGIEGVVGKRLREIVGEEAGEWLARYRKVLETGTPTRFRQELIETGRHLELSAFRLAGCEDRLVAVLFKDVTARKEAEDELHRVNRMLQTRFAEALAERALLAEIVEATDAFVHVIDMDRRWLAINRAAADEFERLFGVRPKVGERASELLADRPDQAAAVERTWMRALSGESFVEIGEFVDPARGRRHYEMRQEVLRDSEGRQTGAYQFVYDVTERLAAEARLAEAEEALRHSQKMEAVGQLTGGLAHDFNNLLGGISGALELIGQRLAQGRPEDIARYVEAAQGAAQRAAALTHRLLAFSRRQTLSPRTVDVVRLIEDLTELVRGSVGPQVALEIAGQADVWPVNVDANQLENALLNLCLNSRDAMPDGGRITISATNLVIASQQAAELEVEPGSYVEIRVSDNGSGIDKATLDRVFEPFFTTKPLGQGTGLGLSMVYGFVRQSAGQVRIESTPGSGTSVSLLLPREPGQTDPRAAIVPAAITGTGSGVVLVVDDEALIRMTVVDDLADHGYTCLEAAEGPQALAILEANPQIELLITDVGLPGGLNGRQVADAARASRPDLGVLFITGYAEHAALNDTHIQDGMGVLIKPFSLSDLVAQVERLLGEGAPAA